MVEAALTVSFFNQPAAVHDCLKLEQKPWSKDVGKTTEMQAILGISAAVYGTRRWPEVFCGGFNGIFEATVYVYPCPLTEFQFHVSHGTVLPPLVEIMYREEVIQTGLQLSHRPEYPVESVDFMAWLGWCYDSQGNVIAHPDVSYSDGVITIGERVYASLRIRYTVIRHTYKVRISKRLLAKENKYQSVAYVVHDSGVKWIDIEAPSGFEKFDGDCGNGAFYDPNMQDGYKNGQLSQTDVCKHEYRKVPMAVTANRHKKVDYCSQEIRSDTVIEDIEWEIREKKCD